MSKGVQHRAWFFSLATAAFFASGGACVIEGDDDDDESGGPVTPCSSGATSDEDEGPTMRPGGDCIACHAREEEGPRYTVAGTVMGAYDDAERCAGVDETTVVITQANGQVLELPTNAVGNFFYSGSLSTPYTAKVKSSAGERAMSAAQSDGDCASCHTAGGRGGAPGRIIAP